MGIWLLLVTSIVAAAGLVLLSTTRNQLERSAEDTLEQLVELEQNRVTAVLDEQRADVESLAADPLLVGLLRSGRTGMHVHDLQLEELLGAATQAGQEIVALRMVNRSGQEVGSTDMAAWEPENMDIALRAMDERSTIVGPGFAMRERDARLGLVTPVVSSDGEVLGAILVEAELQPLIWLSGRYETFGDTSEAFIFQRLPDGSCQLLTDLRFDRSASFTPIGGDFEGPCQSVDDQSPFRGTDYRGVETISAWADIDGADWGLAVKMDRDEVFTLLRQVQWTVGASGLAATVLLLVGWFTLVRPIGSRLARAARAAEQLAAGDFDAYIDDPGKDEIGTMSAGMDRLARDLAEDIKRREEAERRLRFRADYDDLTGAMNRHRTTRRLRELADADQPFAVVFLDLDAFKEINDTYGHSVGDELLQLVTHRIQQAAGPFAHGEELGRWGGDEFVLVVPGAAQGDLAPLVQAVEARFDEPFSTSVAEHRIGVSIGTADNAVLDDSLVHDDPLAHTEQAPRRPSVEAVLLAADTSMYRMKRRRDGRSRVSAQALKNMEEALEESRIDAYLQPLVSVDGNGGVHLTGAEALVRLRSADGTVTLPDDFLPELGASDQAMALDMRVLDLAAEAAADWHRRKVVPPDFYIAVNMGAASLADPRFVEKVASTIDARGLNPENLVVEIPETAQQVDVATTDGLRQLGIQVAIDDVGCQFSNLERLVDINADVAKIDRRWLPDDRHGSSKLELLTGLVDQCRMLDLRIVVEGIENETQLDMVRDLGVNDIQGYLFGRPVNVGQFERMWARSEGRSMRLLTSDSDPDPNPVANPVIARDGS